MELDTENFFLYVHYNMQTLSEWDPRPAVYHWLNETAHRTRDCPKGKRQKYFRGVFKEASGNGSDSESGDEDEIIIRKRKEF